MTTLSCDETNGSPTWGVFDVFKWKFLPEKIGGGRPHIQKYKDIFVKNNKAVILSSSIEYKFPPELLAGVCWVEAGGDPNSIDSIAFSIRSFDWSGPNWMDKHMTTTTNPQKTSFGWVSIQLRTAAETLGLNPKEMTHQQFIELSSCLQKDSHNIKIVSKHLRQILDHDRLQDNPPHVSMDLVKIVGARYNRGLGLTLDQIKKDTKYGDFLVKFWPRFTSLLA